jgi:hypothetical protein
MRDVGPYARVGRVADRENCAWVSTIFVRSGSKKATLTIREGSTILRGLTELCSIDKLKMPSRLKSMLCGKPSAMPFYQRLSRDIGSQAPPLFSHVLKKIREPGGEAM